MKTHFAFAVSVFCLSAFSFIPQISHGAEEAETVKVAETKPADLLADAPYKVSYVWDKAAPGVIVKKSFKNGTCLISVEYPADAKRKKSLMAFNMKGKMQTLGKAVRASCPIKYTGSGVLKIDLQVNDSSKTRIANMVKPVSGKWFFPVATKINHPKAKATDPTAVLENFYSGSIVIYMNAGAKFTLEVQDIWIVAKDSKSDIKCLRVPELPAKK